MKAQHITDAVISTQIGETRKVFDFPAIEKSNLWSLPLRKQALDVQMSMVSKTCYAQSGLPTLNLLICSLFTRFPGTERRAFEVLKSSPWCQNLLADVKTICISLPRWMWYLSINDLVNYPSVWNRNIYIERIRKGLTMMISLLDFYLSRWLSSFCRLISLHVLMLWEELTCPEKMSPLVVNGDAHNWLLRK